MKRCFFLLISVVSVAAVMAFSACASIQKAMDPDVYCIEKKCNQPRHEDSHYCKAHYTLKMYQIVGAAQKAEAELDAN